MFSQVRTNDTSMIRCRNKIKIFPTKLETKSKLDCLLFSWIWLNKKHKTPHVSNLNHVEMLRPNFLPRIHPLRSCLRFSGMKTANFRPKFAVSLSNQWTIRENMCLLLIGTFSLFFSRATLYIMQFLSTGKGWILEFLFSKEIRLKITHLRNTKLQNTNIVQYV